MFLWTTLFNDVAQEHAPIKTRRAKGTHVPSMTNELSDLMRDRDYQHRKARGLKSGYHWNMFCKLRNAVPGNIKTSKSTYYVNLINESKGNSSFIWLMIPQWCLYRYCRIEQLRRYWISHFFHLHLMPCIVLVGNLSVTEAKNIVVLLFINALTILLILILTLFLIRMYIITIREIEKI